MIQAIKLDEILSPSRTPAATFRSASAPLYRFLRPDGNALRRRPPPFDSLLPPVGIRSKLLTCHRIDDRDVFLDSASTNSPSMSIYSLTFSLPPVVVFNSILMDRIFTDLIKKAPRKEVLNSKRYLNYLSFQHGGITISAIPLSSFRSPSSIPYLAASGIRTRRVISILY